MEEKKKKILKIKRKKKDKKEKKISTWFIAMLCCFFLIVTALNITMFMMGLNAVIAIGNESVLDSETGYIANMIQADEIDDDNADWIKVADPYFPEYIFEKMDRFFNFRLYGALKSIYTLQLNPDNSLSYGAGKWVSSQWVENDPKEIGSAVSEEDYPIELQQRILSLEPGRGILYDEKESERFIRKPTKIIYSIYDEEEEKIIGYLVAEPDVMYQQVTTMAQLALFSLVFAVLEILIMAIFIVFIYKKIKKRIISPLGKVKDATEDFVKLSHNDANPENWEFNKPKLKRHDEIDIVNDSVAYMARDMSEYMQTILDEAKEKQRIGTELELAAEIQMGALETKFPAFPNITNVDIYAQMTPAKEVGGDFYDFFPVDDHHIGLVMADVSGKGVPASIYMMIAKIILRQIAMMGYSPKDTLIRLNDQISENNQNSMFVTVWFGVLDVNTGHVVASNAGHEYPVIKTKAGQYEIMKDKHGMPIGAMSGVKYREYEFDVEKGGALFLYTDGAPEATNADTELFGMDRVVESLNRNCDATAKDLIDSLKKDIDEYVGDAPQFDDLTMMSIRMLE